MKSFLLLLLSFYRKAISPYLGNNCRFHPTCSVYAMQAIEKYGAMKGSWLAIKRIGKCHPLHPGGIDEVP
ncbi:MAG: membrane protein insertion efficiency factor YidD [Ignavibacteria bacterium]